MKKIFILLLLVSATKLVAQENNYNLEKGYVAEGYDVTEYFNNKAIKGDAKFTAAYDGVNYKFINQENLKKFKSDPEKFIPQYGGYCAYAIGKDAKKVDVDPKTYEISDGKLYLFYNSWGINTLKKWQEEGASELKEKADMNWQQIIAEQ